MTHWVIRKYEGKIYAGADKLASGHDYPSELSGSGTMPDGSSPCFQSINPGQSLMP